MKLFSTPRRRAAALAAVAMLVGAAFLLRVVALRRHWIVLDAPQVPLADEPLTPKEQDHARWLQTLEETNAIDMRMVTIPEGDFMMGMPDDPRRVLETADQMAPGYEYRLEWFAGETPRHRVRITRPFALGACEVTVGQFAQFVAETSYVTVAEKDGQGGQGWIGKKRKNDFGQLPEFNWRYAGFEQTDAHPVANVTWNDALAFCAWLSAKEGLKYRLPTEAEWEYACRAGTTTAYPSGDNPETLVRIGNVRDKAGHDAFEWHHCLASWDGYASASPVGKFRANAFGLYDMIGNVGEWCSDWYSEQYYGQSPQDDPPGPATGEFHVIRGGGWSRRAIGCRSTSRRNGDDKFRDANVGFRVVCELEVGQ
jgi:sulfatase modifying factor 1